MPLNAGCGVNGPPKVHRAGSDLPPFRTILVFEKVLGTQIMSSTSQSEASQPSEQLQQAREDIRAAGFRATPARIATLLELRAAKSPMTHAELAERLAVHGFDKATAFRNLNDLAERGLLRRTELGDHVWRFEPIDPKHAHEKGHPHFLCVDCGSVTCLEDVQLTSSSRKQSDTVGEVTEILLRGHCNECK